MNQKSVFALIPACWYSWKTTQFPEILTSAPSLPPWLARAIRRTDGLAVELARMVSRKILFGSVFDEELHAIVFASQARLPTSELPSARKV